MQRPASPGVSTAAKQAFANDGVVLIEDAFSTRWVDHLRAAVETALTNPTPLAREFARNGSGSYRGDMYLSASFPEFREFAIESSVADIAIGLLDSAAVFLFNDELLVKEPQTLQETPWHHDLTYWPLDGHQVCSIWIPLDPVDVTSGRLEFVRGSHRWPNRFRPRDFDTGAHRATGGLEEQDVDLGNLDPSTIFTSDVVPGDCLAFHALTLHRSSGNAYTDRRRRAVVLRLIGDQVIYQPRSRTIPLIWAPSMAPGDRFTDSELFPKLRSLVADR